MANEKNVTNETKAVATELINGNLAVVREPILDKHGKQRVTDDGRLWYAYQVRGKVRGRDIKVDFEPKDKGGYEPLDIVFDVSERAELIMEEHEREENGKWVPYMAYSVRTVDGDGIPYECGVKPQRDSDKSLLGMLLNTLGGGRNVA